MSPIPVKSIEPVIGQLDEREQLVLDWYFGLRGNRRHSLAEIAEELRNSALRPLSRQRIHQMKDRAVVKAVGLLRRRKEGTT